MKSFLNKTLSVLAEVILAVFVFVLTLGLYQQNKNKWW
jgi:hypothetical protein